VRVMGIPKSGARFAADGLPAGVEMGMGRVAAMQRFRYWRFGSAGSDIGPAIHVKASLSKSTQLYNTQPISVLLVESKQAW
jgi:hypothetical protein